MGERAKIILNEYFAKSLLMRDTLDLDKFYAADLKLFVEVARKEIERLQKELDKTRLSELDKEYKLNQVREYIEEKEKDDDNWIDYELCIEPVVIKEILDKENK